MKRFISLNVSRWSLLILLTSVFIILSSTPVFSATKSVARLTDFSGLVLIKSQGSWSLKPKKGFPLYPQDKVVTRVGKAVITFNDGAVMEVKANSNLLIDEKEEEEGLVKKVKVLKRRIRLLQGKMLFRTGKSKVKTDLQTSTVVCGLRGTAGVLSIGADGQTYIQFTQGGGITIGDFISGVADDVPAELADLNPAQRAAFVADAAADQAQRAADQAAKGEIPQAQADLAQAIAKEATALEVKTQAEIMLNNPDPAVRQAAQDAITAADAKINEAKQEQRDAEVRGSYT